MKNKILSIVIVVLICAIIIVVGVIIYNNTHNKRESIDINNIGPIIRDQNGDLIPPELIQGAQSGESEIIVPGINNNGGSNVPPEASNTSNVVL